MGLVTALVAVSACFSASDHVTRSQRGAFQRWAHGQDVQRALNETPRLQAFAMDGICVTGTLPEVEVLDRNVDGRPPRTGWSAMPCALGGAARPWVSAVPSLPKDRAGPRSGTRVAPGVFLKLDTTVELLDGRC